MALLDELDEPGCDESVEGGEDILVTIEHLRTVPAWNHRVGFCAPLSRRFAARYGLDWSAFVHDGIPASQLEATGDALALRLVEHARAESANG